MDATLQVRIPGELDERMDAVCDRHGISKSELTRRALTDLCDKMEKAKTPLPAKGE